MRNEGREIVSIATHDDIMDIRFKLNRIEEMIRIDRNTSAIAQRKKAYQEGWDACNSEAVNFCRFVVEALACKDPEEIKEFFDVDSYMDILKRLERTGLIKWDEKLRAYREA